MIRQQERRNEFMKFMYRVNKKTVGDRKCPHTSLITNRRCLAGLVFLLSCNRCYHLEQLQKKSESRIDTLCVSHALLQRKISRLEGLGSDCRLMIVVHTEMINVGNCLKQGSILFASRTLCCSGRYRGWRGLGVIVN